MLNRFRQLAIFRSVRYKLIIASICCILIPAAFTMVIYNSLTQEAVKKQAVSNAQESLLLVNGYVTNLMKNMLNIANYVQLNSDMNTYFKLLVSGNAYRGSNDTYLQFVDKRRINEQLYSIATMGESFNVTVLLTDGSYFTNYSPNDYNPLNFEKEPWFGKLKGLNGVQSYWTGATPTVFPDEKLKNPYQISVVRTLRLDSSGIYGYVIVTVFENQINQIFKHMIDNQEVMILDGSNHILSHKDPAQIGQLLDLKMIGENKPSDIITTNGNKDLVTQMPLSFTDWHLVSTQPYKMAIVNINSIFSRVFTFQVVSFFLFLLLLIYLLNTFTKPLVKLGKIAAKVQMGNLVVRSSVRGQDEVGRLGHSFDLMLDRVNEMIAEVSVTQARKRKAELAMLQAQINPHFLFNVLNSIRMKVIGRGDPESADMIGSLSKLLRMTIMQDKNEISLHEEIELLKDYIKLMNMRQKEEMELIVDVPKEAFLVPVPRFSLQPIIENALIHGFNRSTGKIILSVEMVNEWLILKIQDNGVGMDEAALQELRNKMASGELNTIREHGSDSRFSGIGLLNVLERMKMTFGEKFRMDVQSEQQAGSIITLFIPQKGETLNV
jgi:two-component system, sensor histidine kinase YesM